MASGYKFPILNSNGTVSSTVVDMEDMFVKKELFLNAGLWGWGYNSFGTIGNGSNASPYSSPIQIGALTNWKQISCGAQVTTAIKTDGTLWAWGYNSTGGIGNGTIVNYSSPIQIGSLTNWKQVSSFNNIAAIKTDGTLWTWGGNAYGQLGNGTIVNYSSPIQIGSLTNWKQVSAAYYNTFAVKTDGTLWSWGLNNTGQLGNSTTVNYSSPIQVGALTSWKQVSCGLDYAAGVNVAAIKTDGTLWTWGYNRYGALGNGTTVYYSSPIQIGSLTSWKQVACGATSVWAIKTDGTLWAWGANGSGQLGNGTTVYYSSPIQVGTLTNWKSVAKSHGDYAYRCTFAAIKTDGTLWVCGYNSNIQLGNGTTVNYSSPIQVGSLTNWKDVTVGQATVLAIQSPDLP